MLALVALVANLALVSAAAQSVSTARPVKIVALGDSLTAGLGLPANAVFPIRLQRALTQKGVAVEVVNAGVSGDTTADGLSRLDWSVPDDTDAVILELGANDALRGLDPAQTRANLDAIYPALAAVHGAIFYPFFLDGVAAERGLNQGDGIHPTAAGVDVIVGKILPQVEALVAHARAHPAH